MSLAWQEGPEQNAESSGGEARLGQANAADVSSISPLSARSGSFAFAQPVLHVSTAEARDGGANLLAAQPPSSAWQQGLAAAVGAPTITTGGRQVLSAGSRTAARGGYATPAAATAGFQAVVRILQENCSRPVKKYHNSNLPASADAEPAAERALYASGPGHAFPGGAWASSGAIARWAPFPVAYPQPGQPQGDVEHPSAFPRAAAQRPACCQASIAVWHWPRDIERFSKWRSRHISPQLCCACMDLLYQPDGIILSC